jgi:hypothetical protein
MWPLRGPLSLGLPLLVSLGASVLAALDAGSRPSARCLQALLCSGLGWVLKIFGREHSLPNWSEN